jgi:hypothetical protein
MTPLSRRRPVRAARPVVSARGVVVAALLVLAGLLPGTASAAPEPGLLVVEGRGGTTATLDLKQTVVLGGDFRPTLLGGGDYAGVLITPVEPAPSRDRSPFGAVQVRAFRDSTRDTVSLVGGDPVLEQGRYEVVLLGQGPVRVTYELQDPQAPGVRVQPRTPVPVRFLGRADALPVNAPDARIEMPGALPAGKRAIQVALRDRTSVEDFRMCASTGQPCSSRALPLCPPSPAPCGQGVPTPFLVRSGPAASVLLHQPAPAARGLIWSVDGYYATADDRLRAAAIVF